MLSERYRRLWRRRLRRRPLLPFLMAALLAMDALLAFTFSPSRAEYDVVGAVVSGFFTGQIGLLAAYTTRRLRGWLLRTAVALPGLILISVVALGAYGPPIDHLFALVLFVFATCVVGCVTPRLVASVWRHDNRPRQRKRLSIGWLLGLTLLVSASISFARSADWRIIATADLLRLSSFGFATAFVIGCSLSRARRSWLLVGAPLLASPLMALDWYLVNEMVAHALTMGVCIRLIDRSVPPEPKPREMRHQPIDVLA